ncbi:MAG: hypothetical protein R2747_00510 [Pyrinomonadaceae bacterium]
MRLEAIEKPGGLLLKIAYWLCRRRLGKVITPLKVIYARKPNLLFVSNSLQKASAKLTLDKSVQILVKTYTSMKNGCGFCNDLALSEAVKERLGAEKFFALGRDEAEKAAALSEKERAVVAFLNEYAEDKKVSDRVFAELRRFFSEEELIEIVFLNAVECYYNAMNLPFGIESDNLAELAGE